MAEELLYRTEIGPPLKEMGSKGMAEGMGADALLECYLAETPLQIPPNTSIGQSPAATVGEEGAASHGALYPHSEICLKGRLCGTSERHKSLFSPFAQNTGQAPVKIHLRQVEPCKLRTADSGPIEQLDHGPDSDGPTVLLFDFSELGEVGFFETRWDPLFQLGGQERSGRILGEDAFSAEEAKVSPQGGELASR